MNSRGNVLFLILVAVVLFAALSYAVTRSFSGSSGSGVVDEKARLAAASILSYQVAVKTAVDRMRMSGIAIEDIDYTLPSASSFNTAPYEKKIYHPQGGGLAYQQLPEGAVTAYQLNLQFDFAFLQKFSPISTAYAATVSPQPQIIMVPSDPDVLTSPTTSGGPAIITVQTGDPKGFQLGSFNNFGWTPTTDKEMVSTSYGISKATCMALNEKLTGSTAIPVVATPEKFLVSTIISGTTNSDFSASDCPACENKPAMCIAGSATGPYAFYNLIVER